MKDNLESLILKCFSSELDVRGEFKLTEHLGRWEASIWSGWFKNRYFAEGSTPKEAVKKLVEFMNYGTDEKFDEQVTNKCQKCDYLGKACDDHR